MVWVVFMRYDTGNGFSAGYSFFAFCQQPRDGWIMMMTMYYMATMDWTDVGF